MALIDDDGLKLAVSNVLGNETWYAETVNIDNNIFITALEEYHMAALAVADGDAPLRRSLLSDVTGKVDNMCAKLQHC